MNNVYSSCSSQTFGSLLQLNLENHHLELQNTNSKLAVYDLKLNFHLQRNFVLFAWLKAP